ncbi:MAG: glycoside hydrolase family 28 protein [Cyclobacteriaceae bacterium]|nr:glycoside hydrolase family 28 protein [Cyclobacteriaceae bacterium]
MKTVFAILLVAFLFASCANKSTEQKEEAGPWDHLSSILSQIKEPVFPDTVFNIMDFEAVADGKFDNTQVFAKAIDACSANGGGMVLVPEGQYFTGPIHLKSNVNLHLDKGAEILFSTNPKDYYPLVHTSFEGTELMNYSPLIYAYKQSNVAVTGEGVLNGQANNETWWPWKGSIEYGWKEGEPSQNNPESRESLVSMAEEGKPVEERVFGDGYYFRPNFVEPFECENVLIKGIKIINSPFWVMHPIKCTNVIVDGVTVESHGPNNDGCDPEYSKNVWIKNCTFNTGDDCIAIKSGRNGDGRRVAIPSENIVVQHCNMIDGHGGVVMGSEISAGVRNVYAEDCTMDSPNLDRAIRIKSNSKRGGLVENVFVRNIEVGQVKEAVLKINMHYGAYGNQEGAFVPQVKNVTLENVTVKNGGKYGILIDGDANAPVEDVVLKNVTIEKVKHLYSIENVSKIEFINTYMNGELVQYPENKAANQ